jgi:hypothetical protein
MTPCSSSWWTGGRFRSPWRGIRGWLTDWRLIGEGEGIHWPDLDEDISVESLLAGRQSGESPASLRRWLDARQAP